MSRVYKKTDISIKKTKYYNFLDINEIYYKELKFLFNKKYLKHYIGKIRLYKSFTETNILNIKNINNELFFKTIKYYKFYNKLYGRFLKFNFKNNIMKILKFSNFLNNSLLLLFTYLELKLDTIIFRLNFSNSLLMSQELILNKNVLVNNHIITNINYICNFCDIITLKNFDDYFFFNINSKHYIFNSALFIIFIIITENHNPALTTNKRA
jgi:hypothetical protein